MKAELDKYENPYKVPENYFDDVNRRILSRTTGEKEKKIPVRHFIFRRWQAVAAGIAALILTGILTMKISRTDNLSKALSDVSPEAYMDDIDLLTVEANAGKAGIYETSPEVSSDGIIEYLLQQNIAVTEIYEQL